jgi:beta-1,4-mannosyl-glycoprotein beta-1,4-N-acetylglucosaminyltransferase
MVSGDAYRENTETELTTSKLSYMKIYDAFNFFNELDLLELRLNILDPYVDYFVIVEASVTHSGQPKRFYFEENRNRYERFQAKIINYKIYDTPVDFVNLPSTTDKALQQVYEFIRTQTKRFDRATQLDFGRDFFQKESVRRALIHCNDDDLIIFSDADEIPNPNVLRTIHELDLGHIYSLRQNTYYYYLNVLKQNDWYGSKLLTYEKVKKLSLNEVRGDGALSLKVDDGGWHFSFLGGREHVLQKLLA